MDVVIVGTNQGTAQIFPVEIVYGSSFALIIKVDEFSCFLNRDFALYVRRRKRSLDELDS